MSNAKRLLQFLTFSERPLRIEEAVDALAVDITAKPRFDIKHRMPNPREITSYCASLVVAVVRQEDERESGKFITELQLAHFSVKEYLLSGAIKTSLAADLHETSARNAIAETCLAYLLELDNSQYPEQLRASHPLAEEKETTVLISCHADVKHAQGLFAILQDETFLDLKDLRT